MKKFVYIILPASVLFICFYALNQKQIAPLKIEIEKRVTEKPLDHTTQKTPPILGTLEIDKHQSSGHVVQVPAQHKSAIPDKPDTNEAWVKNHSAGLVIVQKFDTDDYEPIGTVTTAAGAVVNLGETPPFFRAQLQTSECPIMIGIKNDRHTYQIFVASLVTELKGVRQQYLLHIIYPRWFYPGVGLETSGGFVFMKKETPLRRIGVIVPKVIPEKGETTDMLDWQIQVRVNGGAGIDLRGKAKPQSLGSDVVVLMPTHPDKIPASSPVIWFKFEKDGTVSLQDN